MKKDVTDEKDNAADEPVVIPDECGDTMWDAVLEQDMKGSQTNSPKRFDALLKEIHVVQKLRASENDSKTKVQSISP
jgi:hypothetical protein